MTLYDLKPRFQALLRPLAARLVAMGVTANQVTLAAVILSAATGAFLAWSATPAAFLVLPVVLLLRMGLNAIDGMIAREHNQLTRLGMFLNEIGDVVSDIALILPFAMLPAFAPWSVVAFALAAALSEFAGVLAIGAGASRRYDGPMGKSDRALALSAVALLVASGVNLSPTFGAAIFALLTLAALWTVANRVKRALDQA